MVSKKRLSAILVSCGFGITFLVFGIFYLYQAQQIKTLESNISNLSTQYNQVNEFQKTVSENLIDDLYEDHLKLGTTTELENLKSQLENEIESIKNLKSTSDLYQVSQVYKNYTDFLNKVTRNTNVKLETKEVTDKTSAWGNLLLTKDFQTLQTEISDQSKTLDSAYQKYITSITPAVQVAGSKGYSYVNVKIDRGSFGVFLIKLPISEYSIKTLAAAEDDCEDNCPTKSLAQYIKDNNAYAGMNGSYFCPPDYSSCGGKTNSSDYAFYDSNDGKWFNKHALSWNKTGLMVVNNGSLKFYKDTSDFGGGSVSAGISNYPGLLENGKVVIDDDDLTTYQKTGRGYKGAVGKDDKNIYLAIVTNATVPDAAYVLKELGIKDALNLDGGGSSALYIGGGYVVGPGRSLPNAIVLVRK